MKRVFLIIGIVIVLSAALIAWANRDRAATVSTEPASVKVAATFYPLAEFARKVGGEHVSVHVVTPAGAEPHDFEPTPRDIVEIRTSGVFLVNGSGMDPWAMDVALDAAANGVQVVVMADHIDQIANEYDDHGHDNEEDDHGDEDDDHDDEDDHEDEDDHGDESALDPHFWLDPVRAKDMVNLIADTLAATDPENASAYRANAASFNNELDALDVSYREGLAACETDEFVVAHAAFAYLASRYDLHMHPIAGLSPESEPTPRRLAELSELVREKGIEIILFETLVSPKTAQTLAAETGTRTGVLNPLEGLTTAQSAAGMDYVSVMRENLATLRSALRCT